MQHDTNHVQHVQNYWGDLITAAGSQSTDGIAAYVQVNLAGNHSETLGNESVAAVRDIVARSQPPVVPWRNSSALTIAGCDAWWLCSVGAKPSEIQTSCQGSPV